MDGDESSINTTARGTPGRLPDTNPETQALLPNQDRTSSPLRNRILGLVCAIVLG